MPVRFSCTRCQQMLSVTTRKVGSQIRCPKCEKTLVVPAPEEAELQMAIAKDSKHAGRAQVDLSEIVVFDDAPAILDGTTRGLQSGEVTIDRNLVAISRRVLYAQAGLIAIAGLATFSLGYLAGRGTRPKAVEAAAIKPEPVLITGGVTYRNEAGQPVADDGAVLIVFPKANRPDDKIPVAGLRPQDPPPGEANRTIRDIEVADGFYVRADAQGRFTLKLVPGPYLVLLISHHAARLAGSQPKPKDLAILGDYFEGAPDLLGDRKYRLSNRSVAKDAEWDYDLGQSGQRDTL